MKKSKRTPIAELHKMVSERNAKFLLAPRLLKRTNTIAKIWAELILSDPDHYLRALKINNELKKDICSIQVHTPEFRHLLGVIRNTTLDIKKHKPVVPTWFTEMRREMSPREYERQILNFPTPDQ